MKLGASALLEVVRIFQDGILGQKDVSQELRDLEFKLDDGLLEIKEKEKEIEEL